MAEEGRQDLTPQEKEQERRKKRRELRQKKIIAKAGDRLQQITQTYSLEVPPKISPANSQQSSPTSTEPPARLTENYNDLSSSYSTDLREKPDAPEVTVSSPSTSNGETTFSFSSSPDRIGSSNDSSFSTRHSHPTPIQQPYGHTTRRRYSTPPSPTTTGTTPPTSGFASFNQPTGDDSDMDQDDYFRQMLENFRARNNSTGSLASTVGGSVTSDMPYYVSSSVAEEPETEDPSQQLDQLPFPFANLPLQFLPPGFTFQMTGQGQREVDVKSKLWDLTHLLVMCGIGLYTVMEEFSVEKGAWSRFASLKRSGESIGYWPLFWYFTVAEVILQSTRILTSESPLFQNPSVINTLATRLPRPILDVATVLVRYKLIWDCIWTDICVLVFLVGCFIVVGSLFAG